MKYNIIYLDYSRHGMQFLDDGINSMARTGLDDGAKEFESLEDAKAKVRELILGNIPATHICIVQIMPFDIDVK